MAQGKNKRLSKGKKGQKKKYVDPQYKKQWHQLFAPYPFKSGSFGFTCVTRSSGTKKAQDVVKGRVVQYTQADLTQKSDQGIWRKIKLIVDQTVQKKARTSFYGMDITRDKLCQMIRKWKTTIEAYVDCKTLDGYVLRVFTIGFTKSAQKQKKTKTYALHSQVKIIRKKINDIITKEVSSKNISNLVENMITQNVPRNIEKACEKIYPLENVTIRKIKVLQRPKIDSVKLTQMYQIQQKQQKKQ